MLLLPVAPEGVVLLFLLFAYLTVYQVGLPPLMEQQRVLAHPVEVGLNGSQGAGQAVRHLMEAPRREMLKLWRPQWIRTASVWPPSSFSPLAPLAIPQHALRLLRAPTGLHSSLDVPRRS
jgi:hypothetical protein